MDYIAALERISARRDAMKAQAEALGSKPSAADVKSAMERVQALKDEIQAHRDETDRLKVEVQKLKELEGLLLQALKQARAMLSEYNKYKEEVQNESEFTKLSEEESPLAGETN